MTVAWLIRERTGNSGWIDAIWTFALGGIGVLAALAPLSGASWPTARQLLVAALIAVWCLRLGMHVVARTMRLSDDPRYAALAAEWDKDASRRMFIFCQQQAAVTVVLALTMLLAAQNPSPDLRHWSLTRRVRCAIPGSGVGRVIPIISSNGWAGVPIHCSPSISTETIRGAGSHSWGPLACIGCSCMSPEFSL
jgi:hypothetical protein